MFEPHDPLAEWLARNPAEELLALVILVGLILLVLRPWRPPGRRRQTGAFRRVPLRLVQGATPAVRTPPPFNVLDPANQLHAVAAVGFQTVRILNREEAALLPVLEQAVRRVGRGHRVMAQTALGEVIRPVGDPGFQANQAAYASINSKRLDFAIIDRFGFLKLAVEYQGGGHHMSPRSFMRDAVKREALRKAGVAWIEVLPSTPHSKIAAEVVEILTLDRPGRTLSQPENGSAAQA
ncbi:MAG: DUF2726 domain-containing protein [Rhodobacteraceae bacterium]|nr:DUF2726 domain-containing protein [Paracoccaceae bacterium]